MNVQGIRLDLGMIESRWGLISVFVEVDKGSTSVSFYVPSSGRGLGGTATFPLWQWQKFLKKIEEINQAIAEIEERRSRELP